MSSKNLSTEKEILQDLHSFKQRQEKLFSEYEQSQNFALAFLAVWTVFEEGLKKIGELARRQKLRKALQDWCDYLAGNGGKPQKEIRSCTIEIKNIPDITLVEYYLGPLPEELKKVHNSKGKYRKARNKLAHSAAFVKNEDTYRQYVADIGAATNVLLHVLQDKI